MNDKQKVAYASPCFEAEETTNRAFHTSHLVYGERVTCILTVNIGLE